MATEQEYTEQEPWDDHTLWKSMLKELLCWVQIIVLDALLDKKRRDLDHIRAQRCNGEW